MTNVFNAREAARQYLAEGWMPVPVPYRKKNPGLENWPNLRLRQDEIDRHFGNSQNVGILLGEPSGGLVDVDLDVSQALIVAPAFLPATGRKHGRPGKPNSHCWYRCQPIPGSRKFLDVDAKTCLLELRSTGGQTVVPPSTHPEGEQYSWVEIDKPTEIRGEELSACVSRLAAATLVVRHWPNKGSRHDVSLALAGFLLRAGWPEEAAMEFVGAVASAAGDEEWRARQADVRTTARRLATDGKATGGRTLGKLLGDDVVKLFSEWLGLDHASGHDKAASKKESQVSRLLRLAEDAELFHVPDGEAYATVPVENHRENWPIRSKQFRQWLVRLYHIETESAPRAQSVQEAIGTLESHAHFDAVERPIFVRVAEIGGKTYVDLVNKKWEVVEIDASGWRTVTQPPVKFRRARGMLPLPYPVAGGRVDELRRFINVTDTDWDLSVAWIIAAFRARGPFPVLVVHGEHGSAKSTHAKVTRALIDPNTADLRAEPRDVRDLMIAARNGWVIALDNVSYMPPWLSDALCRLATGGGFATRELYTDSEEMLFEAQRPAILNGIEELATRPDLLDRSLILDLPPIPAPRRRPEREFWDDFETARPRILGGLLDVVASALARLPYLKLDTHPRMADFAHWVSAAEAGLRWTDGRFLRSYSGNRSSANELALESSPVAAAVQKLVDHSPLLYRFETGLMTNEEFFSEVCAATGFGGGFDGSLGSTTNL